MLVSVWIGGISVNKGYVHPSAVVDKTAATMRLLESHEAEGVDDG